jgi:hypothetical protein
MIDATVELIERVAGAVTRQLEEKYGRLNEAPVVFEWMTPKQAAGYLKLTPKALEHLRARSAGPDFHRVSGHIRYHLDDLRSWAASQREAH